MAPELLAESTHKDSRILIPGATWADYQRMLELRGERATPRIAYRRGALQLLAPSRRHEYVKSMLGCLFEAWCLLRGVDVTAYGSWTLENEAAECGLDPDECYVLGSDADPERPDLAIEVVVTSGGLDKLEIYKKLGVREVWFWREGALSLHGLRGDVYETIERSELLPAIDLAQLLRFVDVHPMSRATREYEAELRARP